MLCVAGLAAPYSRRSSSRSPFELDPAIWGDGGPQVLTDPLDFPFPLTRPPRARTLFGVAAKVPNVVHYVMLARPDGTTEMEYWQCLSIRSALLVQRPEVLYL